MKTLNEVIKAIEYCLNPADKLGNCMEECPYIHCCDPMSNPVKIDALHYLKEYRNCGACAYADSYLRCTKEDRNDPLTWDELKTMEGKPVFLEQYWYPMEDETGVTEDEVETDKYWAVIDNVQAKRIHFVGKKLIMGMTKSDLDPNKNGGWQAYRKERK